MPDDGRPCRGMSSKRREVHSPRPRRVCSVHVPALLMPEPTRDLRNESSLDCQVKTPWGPIRGSLVSLPFSPEAKKAPTNANRRSGPNNNLAYPSSNHQPIHESRTDPSSPWLFSNKHNNQNNSNSNNINKTTPPPPPVLPSQPLPPQTQSQTQIQTQTRIPPLPPPLPLPPTGASGTTGPGASSRRPRPAAAAARPTPPTRAAPSPPTRPPPGARSPAPCSCRHRRRRRTGTGTGTGTRTGTAAGLGMGIRMGRSLVTQRGARGLVVGAGWEKGGGRGAFLYPWDCWCWCWCWCCAGAPTRATFPPTYRPR